MLVERLNEYWQLIVGAVLIFWVVRRILIRWAVDGMKNSTQAIEWEVQKRVGRTYSGVEITLIALEILAIAINERIALQELFNAPGRFDVVMQRAIRVLAARGDIRDHRNP